MRTLNPEELAKVKLSARNSKEKVDKPKRAQALRSGSNVWARTTRSSVPDDRAVQVSLAYDMANAMLVAQGLPPAPLPHDPPAFIKAAPGRNLFGPGALSDEAFVEYVSLLAPAAVRCFSVTEKPLSPQLLPYLLGGIPMTAVEALSDRAFKVAECFDDGQPQTALLDALCQVGYGERFSHVHSDNIYLETLNLKRKPEETFTEYKHRLDKIQAPKEPGPITKGLSVRQDYLYTLPADGESFAAKLMSFPPYRASMRRRVSRHKVPVIKDVYLLLQKEQEEIPAVGHKVLVDRCGGMIDFLRSTEISDQIFQAAVHRVFERPWKELDLNGVLSHDVEVMVARRLIYRLMGGARNSREPMRMSAKTLVGIALVTGISIAKWAAFAVEDGKRRGESFLNRSIIEEALEILEMSEVAPYIECREYLAECCIQLDTLETDACAWSQRLRKPKRPFWSTRELDYYLKSIVKTHSGGEVDETSIWRYPPEDLR